MKYLIILSFMLVGGGCGLSGGNEPIDNGEFQLYLDSFQSDARLYGKGEGITEGVKVEYDSSLPFRILGRCGLKQNSGIRLPYRLITINPARWTGLSESGRKQLMYHELGHCVLFRVHNDNVYENGRPTSIMNTYHLNRATYDANEKEYIEELFYAR